MKKINFEDYLPEKLKGMTQEDNRLLSEAEEERYWEQVNYIHSRAANQQDFEEGMNLFGLDPKLDKKETINEQHLRRQLS